MSTLHTFTPAVVCPIPFIAIPPPVRGWETETRLDAIPHSLESMDGIPYYDEELAMAQSESHRHTIYRLGTLLDRMAKLAGLRGVSDYPIWYWIPEEQRQKELYPDYALSVNPNIVSLMASELLLVWEVVSTKHVAKERKDTIRMKNYNLANQVPEFALLYPELDDMRSLEWFRLNTTTGKYKQIAMSADRRYRSAAVPELEVEVLVPNDWQLGRKIRIWYRGEVLRDLEEEYQARIDAERMVKQEYQARIDAERMVKQECQARSAAEAEIMRLRELLQQMANKVSDQS